MKITEKQLLKVIGWGGAMLLGVLIYFAKANLDETRNNSREISGLSARIAKLEP